MSFLTATLNSTSYLFSHTNLVEAREFIVPLIADSDPDWLNEPTGRFGALWKREGTPAVLQIIEVAALLYDLQRICTTRSKPLVQKKIKQLLRYPRAQFEHLLGELRIGVILGMRAGPISLEPAVPEELFDSGKEPAGPDYAVLLPDTEAFIEVTTFRVDKLDQWEIALEHVWERVWAAIKKNGAQRSIEVRAPLGVRVGQLQAAQLAALARAIARGKSGEASLAAGAQSVRVRWDAIGNFGTQVRTRGRAVIQSAGGYKFVREFGPEANEAVRKSLRGKILRKKTQLKAWRPMLLVIQNSVGGLTPQQLVGIVERDLWGHMDFAWLSGIAAIRKNRTFGKRESLLPMPISWNPNARVGPTPALRALMESGARYTGGQIRAGQGPR